VSLTTSTVGYPSDSCRASSLIYWRRRCSPQQCPTTQGVGIQGTIETTQAVQQPVQYTAMLCCDLCRVGCCTLNTGVHVRCTQAQCDRPTTLWW